MLPYQWLAVIALQLVFTHPVTYVASLKHCGRGQRFVPSVNGWTEACTPCPDRQFQDSPRHRKINCDLCSPFDLSNPRLVLVDECTRFHDVVAECIPGHFLEGGDCRPCTDCSRLGTAQREPCGKRQDGQCCPYEEMFVQDGQCHVRPVWCGTDQFLVPAASDRPEECRPCETGAHLSEKRHQQTSCTSTRTPAADHEPGQSEASRVTTGYRIVTSLVMAFVLAYIVRTA